MFFIFFSISDRFMFACHFLAFVSCLNYCNLPYFRILSTSIFSSRYFYISLRHICLYITFNAVGVNFVLIALLFLFHCT